MFKFKRAPEDSFKSARIRGLIDDLLRGYYQACTSQELPLRLREVLNKLNNERPELSKRACLGNSLRQSAFGNLTRKRSPPDLNDKFS